jgi:hypothetical protein
MDERERVFDRWEMVPIDPIEIDFWSSHGSVKEVVRTLWDWQGDHPDWNPNANVQEDAEVIWDWITEELQ